MQSVKQFFVVAPQLAASVNFKDATWSYNLVKWINICWIFSILCELACNFSQKNQWQKVWFGRAEPSLFDIMISHFINFELSFTGIQSWITSNTITAVLIGLALTSPIVSSAHVARDIAFYFCNRTRIRSSKSSIESTVKFAMTATASGSAMMFENRYFVSFGIIGSVIVVLLSIIFIIFLLQYSLLLCYYLCFVTLLLLSVFYSKSYLEGIYGYWDGLANWNSCRLNSFMWSIDHTPIIDCIDSDIRYQLTNLIKNNQNFAQLFTFWCCQLKCFDLSNHRSHRCRYRKRNRNRNRNRNGNRNHNVNHSHSHNQYYNDTDTNKSTEISNFRNKNENENENENDSDGDSDFSSMYKHMPTLLIGDVLWIRSIVVCLLNIVHLKPRLDEIKKRLEMIKAREKQRREADLQNIDDIDDTDGTDEKKSDENDENDEIAALEKAGISETDMENKTKLEESINQCIKILPKLVAIKKLDAEMVLDYWTAICDVNKATTNRTKTLVSKKIVRSMNGKAGDIVLKPFVAYLLFYRSVMFGSDYVSGIGGSNTIAEPPREYFANPFNFCNFKDIFIANNPFLTINRDLHFWDEFEGLLNNESGSIDSGGTGDQSIVRTLLFLGLISVTMYAVCYHVTKLVEKYIEKHHSWLGTWFSCIFLRQWGNSGDDTSSRATVGDSTFRNMMGKPNAGDIDNSIIKNDNSSWDDKMDDILVKIRIIIWNLWILEYFESIEKEYADIGNIDDEDENNANLLYFLEGNKDLKNIILEYLVGTTTKRVMCDQSMRDCHNNYSNNNNNNNNNTNNNTPTDDKQMSNCLAMQLVQEMVFCESAFHA